MTTLYKDFYEHLATSINSMILSINSNLDALNTLSDLMIYILDLTSDTNFFMGKAQVKIFYTLLEQTYNGLMASPEDEYQIMPTVKAINNFTILNIDYDLSDFVNNKVWPGSCVPSEWARISEISGFDTSDWNICDIS